MSTSSELATSERLKTMITRLDALGSKWSKDALWAKRLRHQDACEYPNTILSLLRRMNNDVNNAIMTREETRHLTDARDAVALYWAVWQS